MAERKEVLDIEEIAQHIGGEEIAGHHRDDDERGDIGRDGAHPPPGEEDAEIAPGAPDHPVDDLGREHEAAEDEEDLDGRHRDRLGRRS